MNRLWDAIQTMTQRIGDILEPCRPSVYLYGSVTLGDFRPGWSDIDILVLTRGTISQELAHGLVNLRQTMQAEEPDNPYCRCFEGGMLTLTGFLTGQPDTVVYWGTSGQRIATRYAFDSFCMSQLLDSGVLLRGPELRDRLAHPGYNHLRADVQRHYETIRRFVRKTDRDFYAYGWLLDISRCLYTLRTGKILSKTGAGEWALEEKLCPCTEALARALEVRKEPARYEQDSAVFDYAETLADAIQAYGDVLERELEKHPEPKP